MPEVDGVMVDCYTRSNGVVVIAIPEVDGVMVDWDTRGNGVVGDCYLRGRRCHGLLLYLR